MVVRLDPRLELKVGQTIELQLDMGKMHLFDPGSAGTRIEMQ
jgi:hypothetical protein